MPRPCGALASLCYTLRARPGVVYRTFFVFGVCAWRASCALCAVCDEVARPSAPPHPPVGTPRVAKERQGQAWKLGARSQHWRDLALCRATRTTGVVVVLDVETLPAMARARDGAAVPCAPCPVCVSECPCAVYVWCGITTICSWSWCRVIVPVRSRTRFLLGGGPVLTMEIGIPSFLLGSTTQLYLRAVEN